MTRAASKAIDEARRSGVIRDKATGQIHHKPAPPPMRYEIRGGWGAKMLPKQTPRQAEKR